jgi:signal transduction histidine kinase
MRRPRASGLHGSLIAALLAVSALTLAVATVTLLAPLDRRLREDALASLETAAETSRIEFSEVPRRELFPGSRRLERITHSLRRHTGADVVLVGPHGRVFVGGREAQESVTDALRAVRRRVTVHEISGDGDVAEARVALPVRAGKQRLGLGLHRSLEASASAAGAVRRALLPAAAVGFVIATLFGILLARRLVRRLNALRDTALRVAEGEAAEVQPDGTRDEVGDLSRAFATMQRRLREQEEARRTFVATASHELRTPVASLRLMLGLLEEDLSAAEPDLEDARDQVMRANAQSERLGMLAATLLDLSRLDAGVPLRSELVRLDETARAVVAEFEHPGRRPGADLRLTAAEPTWAIADPGSVAQVLRILLDNALRFSPAGEPVEVTVTREDGASAIVVQDSGPGVPPDERERIFERFWRGSAGEASSRSGFGLGLAIGTELARRLGGALRLAPSEHGARFVFTLPAAPGDEHEAAGQPAEAARAPH